MADNLLADLESRLKKVQAAHHEAFSEQEGHDPEWPLWYAEYLGADLGQLLAVEFTQSDLVYLLLTATYEQPAEAPGQEWSVYVARFLAERYGLD